MEKNQEFTVVIEDMSEDGAGVGKLDGYIWFIKDTVIGDVVRAKAMKMKKSADMPLRKPVVKHAEKTAIVEVDLHASALLDTTAGLTSSEILDYQLGKVRETLDQYRHAKGRKIVFIHGKGEGVLRNALLKEIRDKYKNCSCQDASFREYGFGATMVTVH